MISENEFLVRYQAEKPMFFAWGEYVRTIIDNELTKILGCPDEYEKFVKIPVKPRVKDDKSILAKAFLRDKGYSNPYDDITDKVGIRYVLLLVDDLKIIKKIVEKESCWTYEKDRDFEQERCDKPLLFTYQSVHYIVKNVDRIDVSGVSIEQGTPCEIQIRTLLQHAYSELSHATTYKPETLIPADIYRKLARSMAHIETTDELFSEVSKSMKTIDSEKESYLHELNNLYDSVAASETDLRTNFFILDSFWESGKIPQISDLRVYANQNGIKGIINRKHDSDILYRQPIVLFLLYMIDHSSTLVKQNWPLLPARLSPLFSDRGISYDND